MRTTSTQEKKLQKEDKGEEVDGKVVQAPQLGYVPGAFLKKYEDGDQGLLSSMDLKEMLVCVVGHVGGCLDIFIYILLPPSSQVPWVCVIYST